MLEPVQAWIFDHLKRGLWGIFKSKGWDFCLIFAKFEVNWINMRLEVDILSIYTV